MVAVDGGLRHVLELQLQPDWLIGDLDSAAPDQLEKLDLQHTRMLEFPADKDSTDLELTLRHLVDLSVKRITMVGLTGGRLDHMLANIFLLASFDWPFSIDFHSDSGRGFLLTPKHAFKKSLPNDTVLSLLPLTSSVTGVSTKGLHYCLSEAEITFGSTLGVSNIVQADSNQEVVCVTIRSGKLLVIVN